MPPDPEPLPAGRAAVTDQMLHLLYDSRDRWATGITATLHQWQDMAAMLAQVPDSVRRLGFGGLGHLIDAASERIATLHKVSRLQLRRVRAVPDRAGRVPGPPGGSFRDCGETIVGDGRAAVAAREDEMARPSRAGRPPRSRSCSTPPGCSNTA